ISCYLQEKEFAFPAREKKSDLARAITEGICLALYHFDLYKSKPEENGSRVNEIVLLAPSSRLTAVRESVDEARVIASAVWLARDLTVHPSNKATPTYLAKAANDMARKCGIVCRVLDANEIKKLGMGLLLGVARGSHEPAKLIVLEYFGGKKKRAPVVIVGKGVTFDTGGISLKQAQGMDEMKMDMSGGAVTIGVMQAVAGLKLPINVVGVVPATENMPGGSAIKPGDVLTSLSGKTVEVLNTDAEGRLILADALTYAIRQYKPKAIIDLATLTGACIIALGHHAAAILGNNAGLIEKLRQSGTSAGERLWELPLWEEYEKAMKSDVADLKNIGGANVGAGTITGAAFLKSFVEDCPWAHLDIAGTAWTSEERPCVPKGPAGFGVRLLLHYLQNNS
ncbi:MAG: aminopeptidase, partial [Nitrospinae bacterium RIFCSPLOWO2_12_FULL_47_7]